MTSHARRRSKCKMDVNAVPSHRKVPKKVTDDFIKWLTIRTRSYETTWDEIDEQFVYKAKGGVNKMFRCYCYRAVVGPLDIRVVSKDSHPLEKSYIFIGKGLRASEPLKATSSLIDILIVNIDGMNNQPLEEIMMTVKTGITIWQPKKSK